ncbi:hypothetical protein BBOMB_1483 [Bifidobacterium bombi DSM 19703]|uniref:Uncharacterized protein n=1 Tax=Bifidobacterium bombi DSM 19703 TaxID=1341695 RepID=A0A086BNV5_9BIFI|nr:hypothetical protein BBOMB_1483 [Bifidobacterium bombi DSM 19703]
MSNKPLTIAVSFFAVALILAHIISFVTGSQFWGTCTYPAVWVVMIIFMAIESRWKHDKD